MKTPVPQCGRNSILTAMASCHLPKPTWHSDVSEALSSLFTIPRKFNCWLSTRPKPRCPEKMDSRTTTSNAPNSKPSSSTASSISATISCSSWWTKTTMIDSRSTTSLRNWPNYVSGELRSRIQRTPRSGSTNTTKTAAVWSWWTSGCSLQRSRTSTSKRSNWFKS